MTPQLPPAPQHLFSSGNWQGTLQIQPTHCRSTFSKSSPQRMLHNPIHQDCKPDTRAVSYIMPVLNSRPEISAGPQLLLVLYLNTYNYTMLPIHNIIHTILVPQAMYSTLVLTTITFKFLHLHLADTYPEQLTDVQVNITNINYS